jgi:hypothetical protein
MWILFNSKEFWYEVSKLSYLEQLTIVARILGFETEKELE